MNSLKVIFDYDTWQEIFSSIKKNKVRTIITVIGVLWGIFIYITLSGSSNGLDNGFDKEFENIAMNSMFIWTQQTSMPYKGFKTGRRPRLKISDAKVLLNSVPDIQYIAPRNARGFLVVHRLLPLSENLNLVITIFMVTFLNTQKLQQKKFLKVAGL